MVRHESSVQAPMSITPATLVPRKLRAKNRAHTLQQTTHISKTLHAIIFTIGNHIDAPLYASRTKAYHRQAPDQRRSPQRVRSQREHYSPAPVNSKELDRQNGGRRHLMHTSNKMDTSMCGARLTPIRISQALHHRQSTLLEYIA